MAMVLEEMKGDDDGSVKEKGTKAGKASEKLLALVRDEKKKKQAAIMTIKATATIAKCMHTVEKAKTTDFVPSKPEPKDKVVMMIPEQWTSARDFRPVNRSRSEENSRSDEKSSEEGDDDEDDRNNVKSSMSETEDEKEIINFEKNGSPVIQKQKRDRLKFDRRLGPHFRSKTGRSLKFDRT
jgi:hypothetical protein